MWGSRWVLQMKRKKRMKRRGRGKRFKNQEVVAVSCLYKLIFYFFSNFFFFFRFLNGLHNGVFGFSKHQKSSVGSFKDQTTNESLDFIGWAIVSRVDVSATHTLMCQECHMDSHLRKLS